MWRRVKSALVFVSDKKAIILDFIWVQFQDFQTCQMIGQSSFSDSHWTFNLQITFRLRLIWKQKSKQKYGECKKQALWVILCSLRSIALTCRPTSLLNVRFPSEKAPFFPSFFLSCIQASGENCEAKTEGESRTSITPLHYYHAPPRSSDENVTLI